MIVGENLGFTVRHDASLPLAFKLARLFDQPIEDLFQDAEKPVRARKSR